MNATGLFSIGGIASGLDTSGIIQQLMQLERQPVVRMQNTQKQLESVDKAWQSINTKLSSLRTAVDTIRRPDRFDNLVAVSSSNTDAVGVTKASVANTGTLTFHVDQLARAHQAATGTFASATDAIGTTGTVSVALAGQIHDVTVEVGDSLQDVATKLNDVKGGFTASVVKTGDGEHRLVLDASSTGTANALTISSDTGLAQFDAYDAATNTNGLRTLQAAADAKVRMGSGAEAIVITRSSNTIDDLVPGATITLKQATSQIAADGTVTDGVPVTVTAERDVDGAVKAVKAYVEALNGAIGTVAGLTAYDAETKTSGALQGDPYARQLLDNLRSAATSPLGAKTGTFGGAFDVGVSLDRHGKVVLDETKLKAALTQDFEGVGRVFSRNAVATDELATGTTGTSKTVAGTYEVKVTAAATAARAAGAIFGPAGPTEPKTFRITSGGKVASITVDTSTMTSTEIVEALNVALQEQAITSVTASQDGDNLVLQESRYGASSSFTVEELDANGDPVAAPSWFTDVTYAGADAAGEVLIDGVWQALQGAGRSLKATAGAGPAEGLSFTWTGTDPIDPLTPIELDVSFTHGLAGSVDKVLTAAEGSFGLVASARNGIADQIDIYQTRIDGFEQRLATRESTLVRQFTAMEVALSNMQAQGSWLTSQLSSLNGLSQQQ